MAPASLLVLHRFDWCSLLVLQQWACGDSALTAPPESLAEQRVPWPAVTGGGTPKTPFDVKVASYMLTSWKKSGQGGWGLEGEEDKKMSFICRVLQT
jgi:hypothetical protein